MKAIFSYIIAGFACLFLAGAASAQCGVVRHGPIYHAPTVVTKVVETPVVTPVAVPVLVPAFQFQYTPPCAVPVPAGYAGQVAPGYGVGPAPVAQPGVGYGQMASGYGPPVAAAPAVPAATAPVVNNQDRIRELAKALLDEMAKQSGPSDDGPPAVPGAPAASPPGAIPPVGTPPGVKTAPVPAPIGPPGVPPGLPQAPAISPADAAPVAIATLQAKCAACHTGPASKGEFVMFAQPGLFNQGIPWRSIVREIDAGRMPPQYSQYRITPQEAAAVRAWLSGI